MMVFRWIRESEWGKWGAEGEIDRAVKCVGFNNWRNKIEQKEINVGMIDTMRN